MHPTPNSAKPEAQNSIMRLQCAAAALVACGLRLAYATVSDGSSSPVVDLDDKNFDSTVSNEHDLWIIKFTAPVSPALHFYPNQHMMKEISQWCGHCKVLNPEFEAAARQIESVKFGAVDATSSPTLKARFGVQSYPTIVWGRAGALKPYTAGRSRRELGAFARLIARSAVTSVSSLAGATGEDYPVAFVYVGDPTGPLHEAFSSVAERKHGSFPFAIAPAEAAPKASIVPALLRVESGEEAIPFVGESTAAAVEAWVQDSRFRTLTKLGPGVFHDVAHRGGRMLVIGVLDERHAASAHAARALHALARRQGPLHRASPDAFRAFRFATLNGTQWVDYIGKYNISPADMPKLLVLDAPAGVYYLDASVDEQDEMVTWLQEVAAGKVPKNREGLLHFPTLAYNLYILPYLPWSAVALAVVAAVVAAAVARTCLAASDTKAETALKKKK